MYSGSAMKPRRNKLKPEVFEEARKDVKASFPYEVVRIGFFTHDPAGASVFGGIAKVAKSVLMTIVGDSVNIRAYREPVSSVEGVLYKVDEYHGVNHANVIKIPGSQVPNHYIPHDIEKDMIEQNNMSVEVVPDGHGNLKPNVQPDGMVKAYVNFPDPTEEILRQAMERAAKRGTDTH